VRKNYLADCVNVELVVRNSAVGDRVLSIRGESSAVTIWQIIYYESANNGWGGTSLVQGLDVCEICFHGWDLGRSITFTSCQYDTWSSYVWICTYSQTNVPTLATAEALVANEAVREGMARLYISEE
jgi:hypothetical protein